MSEVHGSASAADAGQFDQQVGYKGPRIDANAKEASLYVQDEITQW